jgi:ribonucleotide monophosphatase NagD (HAD superfamily)
VRGNSRFTPLDLQARLRVMGLDVPVASTCTSALATARFLEQQRPGGSAKDLGIRSVPAVVIDGTLAECCTGCGSDIATLRTAGLGQPRKD